MLQMSRRRRSESVTMYLKFPPRLCLKNNFRPAASFMMAQKFLLALRATRCHEETTIVSGRRRPGVVASAGPSDILGIPRLPEPHADGA
jgi:hypothetical protein